MTRDDFDYAIENTHVIVAPEQKIATFGSTSFNFYLISELMDRVNQVRIRNGKIHAERPQILTRNIIAGCCSRALVRKRSATSIGYGNMRGISPCSVTAFNFVKPI